jgi:RNA polymerase sigma-70 factor (family 1)
LNDYCTYKDEELLLLLSERNESAFNELFKRHREKLYHYLIKITHSEQIAEEIVIDVFVKIWIGRKLLANITSLEGFLITVAKNKGLDFLRTTARHQRLREIYSKTMDTTLDKPADEMMIDAEAVALLNSAVNQLPPQRRLVYKMRNEKQMSYEEIALALNLSKNTVRNQLSSASSSIAEFLRKQFPGKAALAFFLYTSV